MDTVKMAEDVAVGNTIELTTQFGIKHVRITQIQHRENGIKFIGLGADGRRYSFGFPYGEVVNFAEEIGE